MSVINICCAAAKAYARAGWLVFPSPRDTKMSYKSAAKSNGEKWGATKNPAEIEADWKRWPTANVCIVTGKISKIWVLETDTAKGHGDGIDGEAALKAFVAENANGENLPITRTIQSPSGSNHYYFNEPPLGLEVRNSAGKLAPGIDVRGEGGMVVAPPSVRHDGEYKCIVDAPVANAPRWLLDRVTTREWRYSNNKQNQDELADPQLVAETVKHIADLVSHLPDSLAVNADEWRKVGLAIYAATDGNEEGFKLFDWFSQKAPEKYNKKYTTRQCWNQFHKSPPNRTGVVGLLKRVDQNWLDRLFLEMNNLGRE